MKCCTCVQPLDMLVQTMQAVPAQNRLVEGVFHFSFVFSLLDHGGFLDGFLISTDNNQGRP